MGKDPAENELSRDQNQICFSDTRCELNSDASLDSLDRPADAALQQERIEPTNTRHTEEKWGEKRNRDSKWCRVQVQLALRPSCGLLVTGDDVSILLGHCPFCSSGFLLAFFLFTKLQLNCSPSGTSSVSWSCASRQNLALNSSYLTSPHLPRHGSELGVASGLGGVN